MSSQSPKEFKQLEGLSEAYQGLKKTDRCPLTKKQANKENKMIKNCPCSGCTTWMSASEEQQNREDDLENPRNPQSRWPQLLAVAGLTLATVSGILISKSSKSTPPPSRTNPSASPKPSAKEPVLTNSRVYTDYSIPDRPLPLEQDLNQFLELRPLQLDSTEPGEFTPENLQNCYHRLEEEGIGYFTRKHQSSPETLFIGWRHENFENHRSGQRTNERSQFLLLRTLLLLYTEAGVKTYRVEGRSIRNPLPTPEGFTVTPELISKLASDEQHFVSFIRRHHKDFYNNVVDLMLLAFPQTGGTYCEDYDYMIQKDLTTSALNQHMRLVNNIRALVRRHGGFNIGVARNRHNQPVQFCLGPGGDMPFNIHQRDQVFDAVSAHIAFLEDVLDPAPERLIPGALKDLPNSGPAPQVLIYGASHHDDFQTFFKDTDFFGLAVNRPTHRNTAAKLDRIRAELNLWQHLRSRLRALLY